MEIYFSWWKNIILSYLTFISANIFIHVYGCYYILHNTMLHKVTESLSLIFWILHGICFGVIFWWAHTYKYQLHYFIERNYLRTEKPGAEDRWLPSASKTRTRDYLTINEQLRSIYSGEISCNSQIVLNCTKWNEILLSV